METTNFFSQIMAMNLSGVLHLKIERASEDLVVVVWVDPNTCGDPAAKHIPPIVMNEKPARFDREFFESVTHPLQQTDRLFTGMDNYRKALDQAALQSAEKKAKAEPAEKSKESNKPDKKYSEALQQSEVLEKQGKFREAYAKLPDPALFPQHAEAIKERRTKLSVRFAPDLFAADTDTSPETEEVAEAAEKEPAGLFDLPDPAAPSIGQDEDDDADENSWL